MFSPEKQLNKKELPIGTGRESEPKETLPAVEVANEVIWVNPDFPEMPFDIKKGESTKLGMFLTPEPKEGEKSFDLKVLSRHKRSGLLGRVIFCDQQGHFYRDVDLMGIGYIIKRTRLEVEPVYPCGDNETARGILNLADAVGAKDKSEEFLKAGIRTERYLAFIKLKEIVDSDGKRISIKKAEQKNILNLDQKPIIALRAMGTKYRVFNLVPFLEGRIKNKKAILEDARKLVAPESGVKDKNFSQEDYLKWFAKTSGENLGLMHKNRWRHGNLTPHNVTLDCRIVDLDSVEDFPADETGTKNAIQRDFKDLFGTIRCLRDYSTRKDANISDEDLFKVFSNTYIKTLGYTPGFLAKK